MNTVIETYEEAVKRTGRKWPYRTKEWPCPACGEAECDLDIEITWHDRTWSRIVYQHQREPGARVILEQ